jgi:glycosyltransferase involved in cell wall biosynthesis
MNQTEIKTKFKKLACAVLIPTYNNAGTLGDVIRTTLLYCDDVIVVNDGATDNTNEVLSQFPQIKIYRHPKNLGKGMALRNGFRLAEELGFRYLISIDSDGQHYPDDFEAFLTKVELEPDSLIIGARNMQVKNVPGKSTFGNRFSNFWFWAETGVRLPDTQSGFRLYPIQKLKKIWFFSTKFEFEIEVIVKAAWRGIPVIQVPVKVYYDAPDKRISHFRPGKDFTRISFLNTYLFLLSLLFWRPVMVLRKLSWSNLKKIWYQHIIAKHESASRKSFSVALGLFFGIIPLWGFQLALAILFAYLLKMNKAIVILCANISMPIFLPFVLFASLKTGEFFLHRKVNFFFERKLSLELLRKNAEDLYTYFVGASILSVIAAITGFVLSFILLKLFGHKQSGSLA